jgi:hypothetical protein
MYVWGVEWSLGSLCRKGSVWKCGGEACGDVFGDDSRDIRSNQAGGYVCAVRSVFEDAEYGRS